MKWIILAILSLIWGSSFILIKKSLLAFSPLQVGMLRVAVSAIAMLPVLLIKWKELRREDLYFIVVVGLMGTGIPSFLYPMAQTKVDSSVAGVLNSLTPLFTFLLGMLFFKLKYTNRKMLGVFLGLVGAALLVLVRSGLVLGETAIYSVFILIATICYAISVNTVNTYLKNTNALIITSVSIGLMGIPAIIYLWQSGLVETLQTHPQAMFSLACVSVLGVFGTALASLVFFYLVQKTDAVFGASVAYLIPVVALAFALFDGESIHLGHVVGLGFILSGIYLNRS